MKKYSRQTSSASSSHLCHCLFDLGLVMSVKCVLLSLDSVKEHRVDVLGSRGKHAEDTYAGNCVDSKWWLPPSCRGNVYQCVPYLSGGNGWGIEEMMQKTTIFSMPMALAVAASWGDYTTLPLSGEITMYWWTPDPTFLDLSPIALKFPPAKLLQRTSIPWWVVTWRFWLLLLRGLLTLWRYSHTWRISWRITKTKLWTILNPPGEMWLVSGSGQIELCGKVGFLMKVKLGEAGLESVFFFWKDFSLQKTWEKYFQVDLETAFHPFFFSWLRNAFLASGSTIPCWRSTPMIGIRPMPLCARRDKFEREACVGLVCVFWFLLFELLWILVVSYPILSYPILSINLSINH